MKQSRLGRRGDGSSGRSGASGIASWSLTTKILVIVLGGILLPGLVLLLGGVGAIRAGLRSEAQSRAATTALSAMDSVASLLTRELTLLRGIAADPVIIDACQTANAQDRRLREQALEALEDAWRGASDNSDTVRAIVDPAQNAVAAQLQAHLGDEPYIEEILVTDGVGGVVGATARPFRVYLSDVPWWNRVFNWDQGGLYVAIEGEDTATDTGDRLYLRVAVPVYVTEENRSRFAGAVQTLVSLEAVEQAMRVPQITEGQETLLADLRGQVLVQSGAEEFTQVPESWLGREYSASRNRHWHEATLADDTDVLLGHGSMRYLEFDREDETSFLEGLEWVSFVYEPVRSAYGEVRRLSTRIFVMELLVTLVFAGTAYLWSQSMIRPLNQVVDFTRNTVVPWIVGGETRTGQAQGGRMGPPPLTVEALQEGHGPYRAWLSSHPEAGLLALAINRLLEEEEILIAGIRSRDRDQQHEAERRQSDVRLTSSIGDIVSVATNVDVLTQRVVDLVREHFNIYFVGCYFAHTSVVAESGGGGVRQWAVLRAGTGEAGEALIARGHRVQVMESASVQASMIPGVEATQDRPDPVAACVATGRLQVVRNLGAGYARADEDILPYARAELVVPLRSRGIVLGAISALSFQSDTFDDATVLAFQMIADRVAVAIDSIRLYEESRTATTRLQRAYGELSREAWQQAVGQDVGRGYEARVTGVRALEALLPNLWSPDARDVWRRGEGVMQSRILEDRGNEAFRLALPIRIRGGAEGDDSRSSDVIGILEVEKLAGEGDWTPSEIDQIRALTEQLGQTLENARLYEVTQRSALEEQMVGDVTRRLRETLSVDSVLQTAVRELRELLRLNEVEVRVGAGWAGANDTQVGADDGSGNGHGAE